MQTLEQWLNENHQQPRPRKLYALIDSAIDASLPKSLFESEHSLIFRSLFDHKSPLLNDIAPYLIRLNATMYHRIVNNIMQYSWGYFVLSWDGIDNLHAHFTRQLDAQLPDGTKATFRFYDPRVIVPYCDRSKPNDVMQLLGRDNLIIAPDLNRRNWLLINANGGQFKHLDI